MSVLLADLDATCAALGYSDGQRYQAEPDAIQGLKHLIWILRRDLDNHEYRRHLGRSKVLQTDLVYMLPDYVQDDEFADVLIRLLVILSNPTLLLYRDGPPKDNHGRKVFLELIDILQGYKSAFTRDKVWLALFGKLKTALEVDWAVRSEEQCLLIERILVLIRNVLQVPANPEAEGRADNDASVHDQVIWALHQSGILDLVLFVISSPDEHQFHLHGLEILCLIYREQTADSLADASLQRSTSEKQRDEQELLAARRREKEQRKARPLPGRHSRFGGTYVIRNLKSVSDRDIICHQPLERVAAMDFDREKEQQRRSHRHVQEEAQQTRRSAYSIRLCLREYCIEVLRSAYNTLVRQVRRVLERNAGSSGHDDSYLLWAIRFFMEFNRLNGQQLQLVSESLSVQCFHWVLTRMQHDMDMIVSDKKQARLWAKRLHVALKTFRELLLSLLALQKLQDDNARALFDMLLNNVCYVLEYRETILHLLMNYNEAHSTKVYLRDVVETAHIFIKMMEKFSKDSVLVQDKKRPKKRAGKKATKKPEKTSAETEEELANKWAEMAAEVTSLLSNELQIAEEDQPIPFDATSEKPIDDQKEDCMIRIHKMLREEKLEQAVALMRSAREVWPENDVFGAMSAAPEDELLLLREIFLHNITTVEKNVVDEEGEANDEYDEENENEEIEDSGRVEKTFQFDDFAKRLLNPKIVRACTVVLSDWQQIPQKPLKAAVVLLHRISFGCSCPAMLYQAKLFRIFQQVFHAPRELHHEELRRLGVYIMRKFVEIAPTNPKIYAELLFYKNVREANELESGYCDDYESGTKGTWTEEQEAELRFLFEENQRNPETDKDVINWILENLIDQTRTRRGVLKKMRELDLEFKAPTKKSSANAAAAKHLWRPEEDEELRSLYDQYRTEDDCLQRIIDEFLDRRNKQQIIKRMLQLHMIADKSEIVPQKPRKRKNKKNAGEQDAADEYEFMEEPQFGDDDGQTRARPTKTTKAKKSKPKPQQRKVVRTALDVGTIRALIAQVDSEKYQEAIDWLKECLDDAADETEEPSEEDDGVPLLPLQEIQKEAMEDGNFKKLLVALGIQPPIVGMESYWRVPTYLNSADLKLRSKIVAGEEVEVDVEGIEDEHEESGGEEDAGNDENDAESEEDFFDGYMQRQRKQLEGVDDYMDKQRQKMNSIMFSKSDEEENKNHAPLKEKKKRQRKPKKPKEDSEDDDDVDVDEIKKKLDRKKRAPDMSSDDDEEETDESTKKRKTKAKKKTAKLSKVEEEVASTSNTNSGDLFDQLKAKRAGKAKLSDMVAEVTNTEDNDEFNFNSEDYRKRLLELGGDSDDDDNNDNRKGEEEAEEQDNEKTITEANTTKTRIRRRANVIDSDSDEQEESGNVERSNDGKDGNDDNDDGKKKNADGGHDNNDVVDKTSNQAKADDGGGDNDDGNDDVGDDGVATWAATTSAAAAAAGANKKRRRAESVGSDFEDVNNEIDAAAKDENEDEDKDEGARFLVRKKPTKAERTLIATEQKPTKRRRIAIIDDDDEEN